MSSGSGRKRISRTFAVRIFLLGAVPACLFMVGVSLPVAAENGQRLPGIWFTVEHDLYYLNPDAKPSIVVSRSNTNPEALRSVQ